MTHYGKALLLIFLCMCSAKGEVCKAHPIEPNLDRVIEYTLPIQDNTADWTHSYEIPCTNSQDNVDNMQCILAEEHEELWGFYDDVLGVSIISVLLVVVAFFIGIPVGFLVLLMYVGNHPNQRYRQRNLMTRFVQVLFGLIAVCIILAIMGC